jgi:hypothetical protein
MVCFLKKLTTRIRTTKKPRSRLTRFPRVSLIEIAAKIITAYKI